ncbi:hypothetical protein BJF83_23515 [Nocardiopsis sp. CNR-923]|uniref:hypothetical protein n=1 Tax=Nocardiopsis sp. CNR-923 TaxID=1904965 RepID=UPI000968303A|nr:hypothetical protein [Nocardiopsis sp. CNR-923]OLT24936.1 hypothetical protein BJF83_23515 [Nocardiopsis sp. CNR-923]
MNGRQTCEAVDAEYDLMVDFRISPGAAAVSTAHILARSTDPVLAAFAEPALEDLGEGDELEGVVSAEHSQAAAQHYCVLSYPGTGMLRSPSM